MTEAEWNNCTDPQAMLNWLQERGRLTDRKARLVAVAACRSWWQLLEDERSRRAVEVAELVAEGCGSPEERQRAEADAETAYEETRPACEAARSANALASKSGAIARTAGRPIAVSCAALAAAATCRERPAEAAGQAVNAMTMAVVSLTIPLGLATEDWDAGWRSVESAHAERIRCMGGPWHFHPTSIHASLLVPEVVALATTIYEQRALARLPELAHALADAGCTDADLLDHLRGPGPHGKGCWALDEILQRR